VGISTLMMPSLPAQFEVFRDEEARPLIVTCIGIDLGAAKVRVRTMHGRRRVPTLMKLAARLARSGAG
jgi:deoxyribonuclease V